MRTQTVVQSIASSFQAFDNCLESGNILWQGRHRERIELLCRDALPRGSGYDSGTTFSFEESTPKRLVFNTSFHHMNDVGYYDGWTTHSVIVTPAFDGFDLRVTGRNSRDIKEYIAQTFHEALSAPAPELKAFEQVPLA